MTTFQLDKETRTKLVTVIGKKTGNAADAEDIVQDASRWLVRHVQAGHAVPKELVFNTLLMKSKNLLIDRHRAKKRVLARHRPDAPPKESTPETETVARRAAHPLAEFVRRTKRAHSTDAQMSGGQDHRVRHKMRLAIGTDTNDYAEACAAVMSFLALRDSRLADIKTPSATKEYRALLHPKFMSAHLSLNPFDAPRKAPRTTACYFGREVYDALWFDTPYARLRYPRDYGHPDTPTVIALHGSPPTSILFEVSRYHLGQTLTTIFLITRDTPFSPWQQRLGIIPNLTTGDKPLQLVTARSGHLTHAYEDELPNATSRRETEAVEDARWRLCSQRHGLRFKYGLGSGEPIGSAGIVRHFMHSGGFTLGAEAAATGILSRITKS